MGWTVCRRDMNVPAFGMNAAAPKILVLETPFKKKPARWLDGIKNDMDDRPIWNRIVTKR